MNLVPNKQLLFKVPFQSTKYRKKKMCVDNKVRETSGVVNCLTCRNEKYVYILTKKATSFYYCKKSKACCNVLNIPFKEQNRQLCCSAVTVHIALPERPVATTKKKNHLHFRRNFSANHNQAHPNLNQKRTNRVQIWNKRIRFILADDLSHIKNFYIFLFSFNLHSTSHFYSTYTQLTENHDLLVLQ